MLIFLILSSCARNKLDLSNYQLADSDLQLQIVVSEPEIIAPVAIDFDQKGRLWVAEMPDYMPDINGQNESQAAGRVVILEDLNGDGKMDQSKVFLDKLPQLRAIRLFKNGLLYAVDPNLYFTEIMDDEPHNTIVVDSTYASGGNVEHKPNGLIKNVDNCFYNAKSHYRYCFEDEKWKKKPVFFRGQWGITQDQNGRIYTNDNSNFLFGDVFLPATLTHNPYIENSDGINQDLIKNRRVFPIQSTAVNRGYTNGALDEEGKLINTTSACGPYIHQTATLGSVYQDDAFICVPEANLIKRIKLNTSALEQNGEFAYSDQEFLVSSDEAFRPVNMTCGPDGSMYVVDFHRGIIQHKIYMTNYLREQILDRGLDEITRYGRILKITRKSARTEKNDYNFENMDSLIQYFSSSNPWLRRMAQENLVFAEDESIDPKLYDALNDAGKIAQIHLLWTLRGRGKIDLKKLEDHTFNDPWVISNLLKIVSEVYEENLKNDDDIINLFEKYRNHSSEIVRNHLVANSHVLYQADPSLHQSIWIENSDVLTSAKLSAMPAGKEMSYSLEFSSYNERIKNDKIYYIHKERSNGTSNNGYFLYNQYCSSCHGYGGNGAEGQAPSLIGSKIVNERPEAVPLIIINGLEGEVTVNGMKESYNSIMPPMMKSAHLSSDDILKISNYINNAFSDKVSFLSLQTIDSLKGRYGDRNKLWTEDALLGTE